jgi:hypothetical protein
MQNGEILIGDPERTICRFAEPAMMVDDRAVMMKVERLISKCPGESKVPKLMEYKFDYLTSS